MSSVPVNRRRSLLGGFDKSSAITSATLLGAGAEW
jgi:hypothetical protein